MSTLDKRDAARYGINLKELFPKSAIKWHRTEDGVRVPDFNLTKYQRQKLAKLIKNRAIALAPDAPEFYARAGFYRTGEYIYPSSKNLKIHTIYFAEGLSEFYSANFFGGVAHVQLIPLHSLPEFLEAQAAIDDDEGQFYDKIAIREGDRAVWGQESGFTHAADSADELLIRLQQYKRRGALIGEGGTYDYIQVCYIQFQH